LVIAILIFFVNEIFLTNREGAKHTKEEKRSFFERLLVLYQDFGFNLLLYVFLLMLLFSNFASFASSRFPKSLELAIALAKKDDITRKKFEKWALLTYPNNRV